MKLHIERHDALRVLSLVAGIAARKSTIPILANILLETDDVGLRVYASDMSLEIATRLPARIEEGGATTVSADKLLEIVKNLPEGADMTLTTTADDARMTVKAGKSKFLMPQLEAIDFPRLPSTPGDTFTVMAGDLVTLFDDTMFMGDKDDQRSFVQTVYLTLRGEALRCYGASGQGMGYRDINAPDDAVSFSGEMIHLDHAAKLRGLMANLKADELVKVEAIEGQLSFNIGGSIVRVVCVNGAPVDYDAIAARSKPTHTMTADVELLTGALRRALVMQTEKVRAVRLSCTAGVLTLTARNMQTGESSDAIDVDVDGDFELNVKGPLLLDTLSRIRTESVLIRFAPAAGNTQPLIITDTNEKRSLYLVMPMAL